jgi:hypothetical protein
MWCHGKTGKTGARPERLLRTDRFSIENLIEGSKTTDFEIGEEPSEMGSNRLAQSSVVCQICADHHEVPQAGALI